MAKIISREALKYKIDQANDFTLIEVLSQEEYNKEHIKGAINIPVEKIGREAKERFNNNDEIIVYCSSLSCQASSNAANKLEKLGFNNVYDFEGGKKAWKEAGYPIESNEESIDK